MRHPRVDYWRLEQLVVYP